MASWSWGTKNEDAAKRCDYEAREYRREERRARGYSDPKRVDDMRKHAEYYEDKAKSHR